MMNRRTFLETASTVTAATLLAKKFSWAAGQHKIDKVGVQLYTVRDLMKSDFDGTIAKIVLGDIMAHVVVRVGDNLIESVITRRSAEELNLKKGDTVAAVVKATEVMIQKD